MNHSKEKELDNVIDMFREDDRLIRFIKKVERQSEAIDIDEVDWEAVICDTTLDAYWSDIGGEGA